MCGDGWMIFGRIDKRYFLIFLVDIGCDGGY